MNTPAFCTRCGSALGVGVGFCTHCGAAVSGGAGRRPPSGPGRRSRLPFAGWAGIVALVIVVAAGAIWLAVSLLSDGEDDVPALEVLGEAVPERAVVGSLDLGEPVGVGSATEPPRVQWRLGLVSAPACAGACP